MFLSGGPSNKCGAGYRSSPEQCEQMKVTNDGCEGNEDREDNDRQNKKHTDVMIQVFW